MGIVVAVKKDDTICIASDTMTISGGSRKQSAEDVINSEKIVQWGSSYIGTADHPLWPLVLKSYICQQKAKPSLKSREEIFENFQQMHHVLKEKYYLVAPKDESDVFESLGFESLIVNAHGIFKTYELGSIQQFIRFSAVGSGAEYALGALHALYDRLGSAQEIAAAVLKVVAELDDSSGLPGIFFTVKSP